MWCALLCHTRGDAEIKGLSSGGNDLYKIRTEALHVSNDRIKPSRRVVVRLCKMVIVWLWLVRV